MAISPKKNIEGCEQEKAWLSAPHLQKKKASPKGTSASRVLATKKSPRIKKSKPRSTNLPGTQ